ncbi:hypothetical protein [Azospirillum sp. B510]|uniref:hypothetical protein n=1 Tax=Azospirillum sp. (strain B510) TaxID=137722 RepID=UPI00031031A3|nr:hypothetical protein [Azospirillum sp. B510]
MTRAEAQKLALVAMEMSGKTVGQMWADLRQQSGHPPSRRQKPTWSDVHDWVTALILDAAREDLKRKPQWVAIVIMRKELAHG